MLNKSTYTVEIDDVGNKHWYLDGKRHREDGPACEYADGCKFWYLNNDLLTREQFNLRIVEIDGIKYKLVGMA